MEHCRWLNLCWCWARVDRPVYGVTDEGKAMSTWPVWILENNESWFINLRCSRLSLGGFGWYRVVSGGIGWYRVVSAGIMWYRLVSGGIGWFHTLQIGSGGIGWYRVVLGVIGWYRVVSGGIRWYRVVSGGIRWFHTLQVPPSDPQLINNDWSPWIPYCSYSVCAWGCRIFPPIFSPGNGRINRINVMKSFRFDTCYLHIV
jgi:hypothetical protein